jgi:acetoin utilization deacetylase AcuC-like enzyme
MAGGTHHAYRDCGSGYCIFNDLAICALAALKEPRIKKVLILDLDVHQGDGTAAILQGHPNIFTCSIHAESNFPFRKQQSDLDVHLADEIKDADYLACLDRTLEKIQPHHYDCILFQAGVDPLEEDALGRLALTRAGLRQRNERVFHLHRQYHLPVVIFMGGGYAKPIERTVDAFEDLFTEAAQFTV